MQRQRSYSPQSDAPLEESSDLAFVGMDMRAPPLVQQGYVSSAKNRRITDGVYETRRGLFTPVWTRYASAQFPYRASYNRDDDATWAAGYATTYGGGLFSDPAGETWVVRVCATVLLFFRENEIGRIISFTPGVTVSGPVQVFQNFNELIIVRGNDLTNLRWTGDWTLPVAELVPSSIASGYAAVPNASYGVAWRERTWLLSGRDNVIASRLVDSTQYHTTQGIFYANRGRGDTQRAAAPIGASSLLILKSQSLHVLTYLSADLSDVRIDTVPVDIQFDSPNTVITADGRVWWLDRRGIRTAEVTAANTETKVLVGVTNISDKIAPLIRRIAWQYASTFSAVVTTDRIYFSVALDTQTTPQTLIVWSRITGEWESYDQWNTSTLGGFDVIAFAPATPWINQPRVMAISSLGKIACLEFSMGEDIVGWTASSSNAIRAGIADELVTRGYTAGTNDPKKILRAQVQIDTWNPGSVALQAIFDGPGETATLNPITRDRTKFFTTAADFVGTNIDNRFHAPKRQDYSVVLGFNATSTYPAWQLGVNYVPATPSRVYQPTNGHNYQSIYPIISQVFDPPERTDLWVDVGPRDPLNFAISQWTSGTGAGGRGFTSGDQTWYGDRLYTCILSHTAQHNRPGDPSGQYYWTDLGLDVAGSLGSIFLQAGVRVDDFQTAIERREINREASWCQLAIRGSQGANKVRSVSLECLPGSRTNLTAA